jgi:hypothetical protein
MKTVLLFFLSANGARPTWSPVAEFMLKIQCSAGEFLRLTRDSLSGYERGERKGRCVPRPGPLHRPDLLVSVVERVGEFRVRGQAVVGEGAHESHKRSLLGVGEVQPAGLAGTRGAGRIAQLG